MKSQLRPIGSASRNKQGMGEQDLEFLGVRKRPKGNGPIPGIVLNVHSTDSILLPHSEEFQIL